MKARGLFVFLLILGIFLIPANNALGEELKINGASCLLVEANSGQILYEKNPQLKWYPASVTKIMTLVLALEAVARGDIALTDIISTSEEAASMGGSQVYLYAGEERTLNEMIIAIAVGSGNDASVAVGEFISGSSGGFVKLMNERAKELGMTETNFVNSHGLHDNNHYTTARDLALLARHAIKVPLFLEYTSIYEYDFRPEPKPLKLWNTNRLLKWYEGCDGMKTGYTMESKRNLVSTAQREGLRLVSVVLGVEAAKGHFSESMKLLNYGFNKYSFKELYKPGDIITQCRVEKGSLDNIDLTVEENIGSLEEKGAKPQFETKISCPPSLLAPLKTGSPAGELILERDGIEIGRYKLIITQDIPKGGFLRIWGKMWRAMGVFLI